MPALPKHDRMAQQPASIESLKKVALAAECVVNSQYGWLQWGNDCRRRMNATINMLTPGDADSTVEWKLLDNSTVTLTFEKLRDLALEADALAGPRIAWVFQRVQAVKEKIESGGRVSMRDIAPDTWL